jgi:gliding motility-associated-like protein
VSSGLIEVLPSPTALFSVDPMIRDVFYPVFTFQDLSVSGISQIVNMGDGNLFNQIPNQYYYENYGEFQVTQIVIGSNGCPDTAIQTVTVLPETILYIPNAFTPNNDLLNEEFKPKGLGILDYEMIIFDRWGMQIFESKQIDEGWDGTFKGRRCQQDVYVYKIKFKNAVSQGTETRSGKFSLIR